MKVIGHHSTNGICSYTQMAKEQFKDVSQVLQGNYEAKVVSCDKVIPAAKVVQEMEEVEE